MESKGRLVDISRDWKSGKLRISFELDKNLTDADADAMKGDLRIRAVRWRERRSLDSNAYYYVLCTKIADKLRSSLTEVCNDMIADYGQPMLAGADSEKLQTVALLDSVDWKKLGAMHLRPTTDRWVLGESVYQVYIVMRGSHTYNTAEMTALINGVVEEAKRLGIETATPEEQERMLALWESSRERGASSPTTWDAATSADRELQADIT